MTTSRESAIWGKQGWIALAAAVELAEMGVTANVINPGATDTGWISSDVEESVLRRGTRRLRQSGSLSLLGSGAMDQRPAAVLRRREDLPASPLGIPAPVGSCGALCALELVTEDVCAEWRSVILWIHQTDAFHPLAY